MTQKSRDRDDKAKKVEEIGGRQATGAPPPEVADPSGTVSSTTLSSGAALSTGELLTEVATQATLLVKTQIELAKTELRADLSREITMVGGLSVAAIALLLTVNLLLVAGVFALTRVLPGWLAALAVAGFTLLVAIVAGIFGWGKRVRTPLHRTRQALKEDVQWTKERLA